MPLFTLDSSTTSELRRAALTHPDPRYRMRCKILLRGASAETAREVAEQLGTNESAVRSVRRRFADQGLPGLVDGRSGNGRRRLKLTPAYTQAVRQLLACSPRDHGFSERRWTRFTLARAAARSTGVLVSPATASRLLARLRPHCKYDAVAADSH